MGRIVFLCPFARAEVTGGIKTAYRHAELLSELGAEAFVYQPEGPPSWFESSAKVLRALPPPAAGDTLVFPETLSGQLAQMAEAPLPCRKVLFCQAHFYALFQQIAPQRFGMLGFSKILCQSGIAKGFLERVMQLRDVAIVPCFIDPALFHPRPKAMQIALIPHKLPREAAAIQAVFTLKYPRLQVGWVPIENRSEREIADIFGRSSIVLSLPFLESFGLVPLEAMASGALVVGFHGYGGKEYASAENGFWLAPDHIEEVADALAGAITGLASGAPKLQRMLESGAATAARYSHERTKEALAAAYLRG